MVAIRSSHLNKSGQFDLNKWLDHVGIGQSDARERLVATWQYCVKQTQNVAEAPLLLWRGIEMVEILSTLNMDNDTLRAALLFPLVDDKVVSEDDIKEHFGLEIKNIVHGVLDMAAIKQLKATHNGSNTSTQVDNVRRMLLAMVEDFRCVVIKLAERIAHLREVKYEDEEIRVLVAKECSNIYAPLANRLGIGQLKWEIEDFCFKYLHPEEYKKIASKLDERRIDREHYIADFVAVLNDSMKKEGITADISGRPKHIYSIWRKMQKKSLAFEELYDVRAVRIIVDRLQDCYGALGIVHTLFRHIPKEFDDYIANPKPNGYQSIHTVVIGPKGQVLEIQIRTKKMHVESELGVAAHWKYKEGNNSVRSGYDERIAWLRKLLAWQEEMSDKGEMLDEVRSQVFDDRVYVFTPKGDVIDLPTGSTPLDFAYHIHSDVGHRCIGAKISGRIVPFTYQLQMGDQIEIITQKHPNPSRDWLNPHLGFVNSSRARAKIQAWFRKQDRDKNTLSGRQILDDELARLNISFRDAEKLLVPRYNMHSMEEVLAGIGNGDIRLHQLVNYLQSHFHKPTAEEEDKEALKQLNQKANNTQQQRQVDKTNGRVVVEGVGNLLHHIARCCQPIPGDPITGFITQGRGISIHRSDCEQLLELQSHAPERIVEAEWGDYYSQGYTLTIRVIANDRSGLLRDVTTILANEKVHVLSLASRSDVKKQLATIDMEIEIYNQEALSRVLSKVNQLPDVLEAKRLNRS